MDFAERRLRKILECGTVALKLSRRYDDAVPAQKRDSSQNVAEIRDDVDAAFVAIELLLGMVQGSHEGLRLSFRRQSHNRRSVDLVYQVTDMLQAIVCAGAGEYPVKVDLDDTRMICDTNKLVNFLSALCVCGDPHDRESIVESPALRLFSALLLARPSREAVRRGSALDSQHPPEHWRKNSSGAFPRFEKRDRCTPTSLHQWYQKSSVLFSRRRGLPGHVFSLERQHTMRLKVDCVAAIAGLVSAECSGERVTERVRECIPAVAFDQFATELLACVESRESAVSSTLPHDVFVKATQDLFTIRLCLSKQCDLASNVTLTANGFLTSDNAVISVNRKLSKKLLTLEIYWNGRCSIVVFGAPEYAGGGGDDYVESLVSTLRSNSVAERMSVMMAEAPRLTETMDMIWSITSRNRLYAWINRHENHVNVLLYLLIIAGFLIIAIAADRAENLAHSHRETNHLWRKLSYMGASPPLFRFFRGYNGKAEFFDEKTRRSARVAALLLNIATVGYVFMLGFASINTLPPCLTRHRAALQRNQTARLERALARLQEDTDGASREFCESSGIDDCKSNTAGAAAWRSSKLSKRRDNSALLVLVWWVLLVQLIWVGSAATYGYGYNDAFLYATVGGVVLLLPSRLRRYYVDVDTNDAFYYTTSYDFLMSDARVFGRVLLLLTIVMGNILLEAVSMAGARMMSSASISGRLTASHSVSSKSWSSRRSFRRCCWRSCVLSASLLLLPICCLWSLPSSQSLASCCLTSSRMPRSRFPKTSTTNGAMWKSARLPSNASV